MDLPDLSGPSGIRIRLLAPVAIAILVALPVWAFSWGAARTAPRDVPIGVAGPPAAVAQLSERLSAEGMFDVRAYPDLAAARSAIEDREVYGALVLRPGGTTLLKASAGSPAVAEMLEKMAADGPARPEQTIDVVAASPADPRGAVLASSVMPLVIVSVLTGVIVYLVTRSAWGRSLGLFGGAVLAALVVTGIIQGWLGVLGGDWYLNAAVLALIVMAIAGAEMGAEMLLGPKALAVVAPLMVFIGNPWSGASSAPELLPEPVGWIGQALPPGAGVTLLRSTAFFDGAGSARALVVLLAWAALGLTAIHAADWRHRRLKGRPPTATAAQLAARPGSVL